jgi:bifunctional non-homologous end joining protein LigD
MGLETYRRKRDFSSTPEPGGGDAPAPGGNSFVVQKHDARRLHYDFRLEMDGVLKSWAVTKGPSLVAGEKRLAVHVEDHPLDYGGFEGTIPKGQYGGGAVILWDRGTWTPIGNAAAGYAKGHLEFDLFGKKLKGRWHLVRMHGKQDEKRENWLLIKADDDHARPEGAPDILAERPESVASGRGIADLAAEKPDQTSRTGHGGKAAKPPDATVRSRPVSDPAIQPGARKAALPDFVDPMLASLVTSVPTAERWIHEIKFDGYRLLARIQAGRVKLLTRSGLDWTRKFGQPLVSALQQLPLGTALLDGELVVEVESGGSPFSALQADLAAGRSDRFVYYAFDLLHLDGYDLRALPLVARKALLESVLTDASPTLRFSSHFAESGEMILRHACRLSLEGIVSKLANAPYRSGRGKSWVKSKCSARQELVIGGFVPSTVSRRAIGSLVMGVYDGKRLTYVGRVGTGFTAAVAEDLFQRLERLRVPVSPFAESLTAEQARLVRFVRPALVAEVEFRAWTADGHLRHASFRGLREDKLANEIIREAGKPADRASRPQARTVTLTHPDRVYWPDEGVTKEGLADYYTEVWPLIAPHIVGRPLALLRCPNGIVGERFFQKHPWRGMNPNIAQVTDPKDPGGEPLISIHDLDGLLALVQSAVLEIHPWGSTVADWEHPDTLIMDLDPGDDVTWQAVVDAAIEVRQRLTASGLAAYVKTSGGKGLHVVAPLAPKADWRAVKTFASAFAGAMAADSPDRYVATITKSRRIGKILIDYLRNQRGQTAVAPYSTRARPGAAVSAPLEWAELGPAIGPAHFTVRNMPQRVAAFPPDPWADFRADARPLAPPKQRGKQVA